MGEEVLTLVRIPIHEIEQMVRSKHNLPKALVDIRLESDYLTLYFADKDKTDALIATSVFSPSITIKGKKRKRRARRKRNRMKTRGWNIVARMTNQKGQECVIYKPFVDALSYSLSPVEQRAIVTKILRSNGNRPSEASVSYFLENTLEYLNSEKNL
jgi:hypothetical protein